jgi:hypothetical protein
MKGKFGIVALLFSSITFAAPVSTPNQLSDTPIISGGGTVSGGICRAYRTDGEAVPLSGGETLVFYGGGTAVNTPTHGGGSFPSQAAGGFLSTKITNPITAFLQVRGRASGTCQDYRCYRAYYESCSCESGWYGGWSDGGWYRSDGGWYRGWDWESCSWTCRLVPYTRCDYTYACTHGSAIGLFAGNTTDKNNFIAGAGGAFGTYGGYGGFYAPANGGGWQGEGSLYIALDRRRLYPTGPRIGYVGYVNRAVPPTIYSGEWFGTDLTKLQGFNGGFGGGGASSISAWYNSRTKNYTSVGTSFTLTGGGSPGVDTPTLYVCK